MVMPYGKGKYSMFQPDPFNLTSYIETCKKEYGVSPRPHWISTYYGGQVCTFIQIIFYIF